ncbi:MAG: C40 family peptidase [Beijerinckiaceae bacterium]
MTTNRGHIAGFDRRLTPARPDLAAAYLRGKVDAPRYVEGERMRVIAEAIPLRGEPNPEDGFDTQALYGETLTVYDVDDEGWAYVQLARDGYVGYVSANALSPVEEAATHRVRTPRTLVYPGRSIKTPPLLALPMLAEVSVLGVEGAFAQIAGGGYVWAGHLAPVDAAEPDFVAVAERFEHAPYLWGGKTWDGVDCSGLVQIALQAAGVEAPRDTDLQAGALGAAVGEGANYDHLRRGDLVFWKGHVGIMCDAKTLLHANGHHMQVAREPFDIARARIAQKSFGEVTCVRRL